jgi:hypothetical protein
MLLISLSTHGPTLPSEELGDKRTSADKRKGGRADRVAVRSAPGPE